jgi:molybdate transport system regulatory protein
MQLHSTVWLGDEHSAYFGKGRIELLAHIDELGSISQAAKAMKMSYKAAWDAINEMNTLSPTPIVERATGGRGGGGTHLTSWGQELVAIYRRIEEVQAAFANVLEHYTDDIETLRAFTSKLTVRTSARNQLPATVTAIETEGSRVHVTVMLGWGEALRVQITRRSLEELDIRIGSHVTVLFKPTWVTLDPPQPEAQHPNTLHGTITHIQDEELSIEMAPGHTVIATDTTGTYQEGQPVRLHIDPANALLAI